MGEIDRLEGTPNTGLRRVTAVAVVDPHVADSICAPFQGVAMKARPFYRIADLLGSAEQQRHDGFIIDRIVANASALEFESTRCAGPTPRVRSSFSPRGQEWSTKKTSPGGAPIRPGLQRKPRADVDPLGNAGAPVHVDERAERSGSQPASVV